MLWGTQPRRAAPARPSLPSEQGKSSLEERQRLRLRKQQSRKSYVFPTPSQGLRFYDNTSQQRGSGKGEHGSSQMSGWPHLALAVTLRCQGQRRGRHTLCALAHQGAGSSLPQGPKATQIRGPQEGSRDRPLHSLQQLPGDPPPPVCNPPGPPGGAGNSPSPQLRAPGVPPPISPQILLSSYGSAAAEVA